MNFISAARCNSFESLSLLGKERQKDREWPTAEGEEGRREGGQEQGSTERTEGSCWPLCSQPLIIEKSDGKEGAGFCQLITPALQ